ncbi:MAG: helix-turn-helix domain-containing protein [bacterium]
MKKALIFDNEKFSAESLLQKVKYLFKDPLAEIAVATEIESFRGKIAESAWNMIVVNFQMFYFWDMPDHELETFAREIKDSQEWHMIFIGVTGHRNQHALLGRLGVNVTHKEYASLTTFDYGAKAMKRLEKPEIQRIACDYFMVSKEDIIARSRERGHAKVRHIIMYLTKLFTNDSFECIAREYSGRDHTTAIYACQNVLDLMDTDEQYRGEVMILTEMLKEKGGVEAWKFVRKKKRAKKLMIA